MTLGEIASQARRNLNQNLWDYLRGGADSEAAVIRNRLGLAALAFKPKVLRDVSAIRTERGLLGAQLRIPVILPPIGSVQQFHPGGGASVAEAASEFGTAMILSSACFPGFEEVAPVGDCSKTFQLYLVGDQEWLDDIIERAIAAGYDAFCLTVDTALYSRRERDIHKRFVPGSGRTATGGTVFGPQPRSYAYRLPKKVVRGALRAALTEKFAGGGVLVVVGREDRLLRGGLVRFLFLVLFFLTVRLLLLFLLFFITLLLFRLP